MMLDVCLLNCYFTSDVCFGSSKNVDLYFTFQRVFIQKEKFLCGLVLELLAKKTQVVSKHLDVHFLASSTYPKTYSNPTQTYPKP